MTYIYSSQEKCTKTSSTLILSCRSWMISISQCETRIEWKFGVSGLCLLCVLSGCRCPCVLMSISPVTVAIVQTFKMLAVIQNFSPPFPHCSDKNIACYVTTNHAVISSLSSKLSHKSSQGFTYSNVALLEPGCLLHTYILHTSMYTYTYKAPCGHLYTSLLPV